jgi:hypothetical protein
MTIIKIDADTFEVSSESKRIEKLSELRERLKEAKVHNDLVDKQNAWLPTLTAEQKELVMPMQKMDIRILKDLIKELEEL